MVAIDDIHKLAPDLLKKSRAQLEREITERQMAMAEIERQEQVKAKAELADRANHHIDAIIEGIAFLGENGILPEKVSAAFTRSDGRLVPATVLRHVTPEQLIGAPRVRVRKARDPNAPKRTRRVRDANGNLVPSKASQSA